jgi:hypothetical protein
MQTTHICLHHSATKVLIRVNPGGIQTKMVLLEDVM